MINKGMVGPLVYGMLFEAWIAKFKDKKILEKIKKNWQ